MLPTLCQIQHRCGGETDPARHTGPGRTMAHRWEDAFGHIISAVTSLAEARADVHHDGIYLICSSEPAWSRGYQRDLEYVAYLPPPYKLLMLPAHKESGH